jgi:hypothetical protein
MKKYYFFLLLGMLIYVQPGCKQLSKLTQFNINYNSSVTIPKTLGVNIPVTVVTPPISTQSDQQFESNNTHKNLIDIIHLSEMDMTITSPESASFDFLKNIEISISADGLPDKKIAWLENIPKTGLKHIELDVSTDNIKEYILKDNFTLKTKTTTREIISHDTQMDIHSKFFVDAKILGL